MLLPVSAIFGLPSRVFWTRMLLVLVGGALGSGLRYAVALWTANRFGAFPWGTMAVNVIGCFAIGLFATLADEFGALGPNLRTLLVVGVLGGFTTFSSFSLEAWRLFGERAVRQGDLYLAGNLFGSFVAVTLGIALARGLHR